MLLGWEVDVVTMGSERSDLRLCPQCHTPIGVDAPVCPSCGRSVALEGETPVRGERKPVTALFVDLVGSTTVAEQMDRATRRGFLLAELGNLAEAREVFERVARQDFGEMPRDAVWLEGIVLHAEVCDALGDAERADILYRLISPYRERCVVADRGLVCLGSVERWLGLLATTMPRWEDAIAHFEAALARNEALGSPPLVARVRADYAAMLARRGEPGDLDRAAELRRQAATTARELGMTRLLSELASA